MPRRQGNFDVSRNRIGNRGLFAQFENFRRLFVRYERNAGLPAGHRGAIDVVNVKDCAVSDARLDPLDRIQTKVLRGRSRPVREGRIGRNRAAQQR